MGATKYIIGISAYYHDSSVCVFRNGQLIYACEEEKFTGIKHDKSFPVKALNYAFKNFRIKKDDIEAVCYYEDPILKLKRVKSNFKKNFFKSPIHCIKSYFEIKSNIKNLKRMLSKISSNVFYSTHHESHHYYSYFSSSFDKAISLSVDGVGEFDTLSFAKYDGTDLEYYSYSQYPHSVGLFYSAMTSYLGFKPNEGEYKVMGLASYGNPKTYIDKVRKLITSKNSSIKCDMDVFCWDRNSGIMFNEKLYDILGVEPRMLDEQITQSHMDLAAAVQLRYEEILFDVIKTIGLFDKSTNLCLSGGCAYNGTANGKITKKTHINNIWIPLAPSDAGSSIGAVVNYLIKNKKLNNRITKNPFLGPEFPHKDIKNALKNTKYLKFHSELTLISYVAKKLNEGKVIGWYRGHNEFGARALGNRSILANPTIDGMQDRINKLIKKREMFRPFAPMVTYDKQSKYFDVDCDVPYMNQVVNVRKEYVNILKATTHIDNTARIQTVPRNTIMYRLLTEFEKLSGYPVLLNTSFNIKDKTMVLTPQDAMDTFRDTDIDLLIMDNYLIHKK